MADCGTITIEVAFDPAQVSVTSCISGADTVSPGGSLDVTVFTTNQNDTSALIDVEVTIDGQVVGSRSGISVPRNTFEGQHTITVTAPSATGTGLPVRANKTNVTQAAPARGTDRGSAPQNGDSEGVVSNLNKLRG